MGGSVRALGGVAVNLAEAVTDNSPAALEPLRTSMARFISPHPPVNFSYKLNISFGGTMLLQFSTG